MTFKQKEFVRQYFLNGGNASEAYRQAGYKSKSPNVDASILLANPSISALVAAEEERTRIKYSISDNQGTSAARVTLINNIYIYPATLWSQRFLVCNSNQIFQIAN
jgi:hypothetical protein